MKTRIQKLLVCAALVGATTLVRAQFPYTYNGDGTCTITGYTGPGGAVTIPHLIDGLSVTSIGPDAFFGNSSFTNVTIPDGVSIGVGAFASCYSLTAITVDAANSFYSSVDGVLFDKNQTTLIQFPGGQGGSYTIPASVTSIGDGAFYGCGLTSVAIPTAVTSIGDLAFGDCGNLTTAYFLGNAPYDPGDAFHLGFLDLDPVTVYYLPGATGWGTVFSFAPTELWNPQANASGITGGHFGFNITGPADTVIVVEACTNLAHPIWLPVSTNALDDGGASSFSDSQSGNYPARFYRFRSP